MLATCQSLLDCSSRNLDEFLQDDAPDLTEARAHEVMKDYQSAKWVVNRQATDIVNMAMDLSGGSAFMVGHKLTRRYRDVRAGPFMQPFARPEVRGYIGRVVLGEYPRS